MLAVYFSPFTLASLVQMINYFSRNNVWSVGFCILPYSYMFVALPAIMHWYVVFKGRTPSVYSSWDDCNKEVYGFRCAKHASFTSVKKAIEAYASYLAAEGNQPIGSPVQPTSSPVQPTGSPVTRQVLVLLTFVIVVTVTDTNTVSSPFVIVVNVTTCGTFLICRSVFG